MASTLIQPGQKKAERHKTIQTKRNNHRHGPSTACFSAKKPQKISTKKTLDLITKDTHWYYLRHS